MQNLKNVIGYIHVSYVSEYVISECGVTANILALGASDSGFESRHSDKYIKHPLWVFYICRVQHMNCFMCVGIRKPQLYFASKQNSEEWPASPENDGLRELVGETPGTPTK